jgi:hypothetical protein
MWAGGMIVGATIKIRPVYAFPAAAIAMGLAIAGPAVAGYALVALTGFVLGGVGNRMFNTALGVAIYGRVDPSEQGRAWAAFGLVSSTAVLAGYLVGAVGGASNARWVMLAAGVLPILAAVAAGPPWPRGNNLTSARQVPATAELPYDA